MQSLNRRRALLLAIVLLITPACLFFGRSEPTIENFPAPNMPSAAALGEFDDTTCPVQAGVQTCPPESPLGILGCSQLRAPGEVLAGLQPAYPVRVCLAGEPGQPQAPEGQYLYREGCRAAQAVRYVILRDGEYQVIGDIPGMQRAFAPIQSEAEALSYALATTGLGVRYGLQAEQGLRYFVDELQDTNVRRTSEGYVVHLFDYQICGCGPHPTTEVDVLVTDNGEVRELQRQKVFEDPAEDDLCID